MPIHGYPGNVITANPTAPTSSVATGVWTTEQQLKAVAAGNWPMGLTQISRSLRFNSADSAYLNRTPASAGNRKTWTWNGWVKRSGSGSRLFCSGDQGVSLLRSFLLFGDNISFIDVNASNTTLAYADSVAVFRDYSAWYCITLVIDTTQATGSNRVKLYVNGVQQTLTFSTTPSQNADLAMNAASRMTLGTAYDTSSFLDCYLTEVNFIDGLALDPSYFGFNNSDTGVWSPKQYTGTYGTNGFYLNFSDNSNTTAATLGKDYSGNGNNWTPNNFSVTAGAGNDSMVDSPTSYGTDTGVGGEVRGNYCTWNGALPAAVAGSSIVTLSNGNLDVAFLSQTVGDMFLYATSLLNSGKWYWEFTISATTNNEHRIGVSSQTFSAATGNTEAGYRWTKGTVYVNGTQVASGLSTCTTNDVIGVAIDAVAGTVQWFKNNTSVYTATGVNYSTYIPYMNGDGGSGRSFSGTTNFGQRAFAYTAPSGFKALCTQNLPTPTIGATSTTQANDYFNPVLYTGTGSAQSITGVGFQPDFVWIKKRSGAESHVLSDAIRGTNNFLSSNSTAAENTASGTLTAFNSDGFSLGTQGIVNDNTFTFVAWNWNAGGSTVTNTSGTISAQVRANTTSGFSVVTFNIPGSGTSDTVGHGLGVAPSMVILKPRTAGTSWGVYHSGLTSAAYYLTLQTTNAQASSNSWWNSTAPTSSVFTIGATWYGTTNAVAYCFAPVAGYSAFGSYTGNGSTDGPFVYLGFRPAFVFWKRSDGAESWWINDIDRLGYNGANRALFPNASSAENTANNIDILSNGFKVRGSGGEVNASGGTYIYACFAENPFKYSLAR
jgi:hypothetical protein